MRSLRSARGAQGGGPHQPRRAGCNRRHQRPRLLRVSGSRSLDPLAIWQSNTIPGPKLPKGAQGAQDASPSAIAEAAGVSRQAAYRVQDAPRRAEVMLAAGNVGPGFRVILLAPNARLDR